MPQPREQSPELLAPAGDWECLRAAVANGADAVYFGVSGFNARHRATNFAPEELVDVMRYLHAHNVRGYAAFNVLIFSDELAEAARMAELLAAAGTDAVIVQDLGLAALIHRLAPRLAIHASTQMTLTEARGIEFVRRLGVQRIILARELALRDIASLSAQTDMPLEVFVHGALCVAYSGQCLTSEALGGRSANRGQCAQACRLPYELIVDGRQRSLGDKAYLLSPQDLAAYDRVEQLVRLGVAGFKIEGRLKSAHYVAATTQTYRAALNAAVRGERFDISATQKTDLTQSFSRGFTHGFLDGIDHQQLVQGHFPKSRGVRLGTVAGKSARGVVVLLGTEAPAGCPLRPGDGVVFDEGHPEQWEQGGRVFEVGMSPSQSSEARERKIQITFREGDVNLAGVALGSIVWKTDDPAMRRRLAQSYARDVVPRRVPLSLIVTAHAGAALRVEVRDDAGHQARVQWAGPLQKADKHPVTVELLRAQFGRLGETPFVLDQVTLTGDRPGGEAQPVMVPKSILNDLRRQAAAALTAQRASGAHAGIADPRALEHLRSEMLGGLERQAADPATAAAETAAPQLPRLYVLARTVEQLEGVLQWRPPAGTSRPAMVYCDFEDVRRYKQAVECARAAALPVGLATLRVLKPGEEGWLRVIADCHPDAVLVRNLAALDYYTRAGVAIPGAPALADKPPVAPLPGIQVIGDYSLNIANEITAGLLHRHGLQRLTPSYDLSWPELAAMLGRATPAHRGIFEVVVHQHMPMFHMEHCVFAHTLSHGKDYRDCGRPCDRHAVDLRDRMGVVHPLLADAGCRNTLFNAQVQSAAGFIPRMLKMGLRHFRVELLRHSREEVGPLLDSYAVVVSG